MTKFMLNHCGASQCGLCKVEKVETERSSIPAGARESLERTQLPEAVIEPVCILHGDAFVIGSNGL